jgi:hypothetical protein
MAWFRKTSESKTDQLGSTVMKWMLFGRFVMKQMFFKFPNEEWLKNFSSVMLANAQIENHH